MLGVIYSIIILALSFLFFLSLFLFIKRRSENSSTSVNETISNGEKLDLIIEQNEKLISLLEKKREQE